MCPTVPVETVNLSASIFPTLTKLDSVFSVSENKCDYCGLVFISSDYLKNHIYKVHRLPMCPEKATYYYPKDLCPPHAPPPPKCVKCNIKTNWTASRIKADKSWLHEFNYLSIYLLSVSVTLGFTGYRLDKYNTGS